MQTFVSKLCNLAGASMLICGAILLPCSAQEQGSQELLSEINEKITTAEARLRTLSSRQTDLESALKELKASVTVLRNQEQGFKTQYDEKNTRRKTLLLEIKQTKAGIERIKALSLLRLRALYMNRTDLLMQRLITLEDGSRFSTAALYIKRLKEFDAATLERLATLQKEQNQRQAELEEVLTAQASLQSQIKSRREKIEQKALGQEAVLKELRNQKALALQILAGLRAQALRLETVVASLTGGEGTVEPSSLKGSSTAPDLRISQKGTVSPFNGRGLRNQIGNLYAPVVGQVLERFGEKRSLGFDESVQSKGVEYNCAGGTPVQAVGVGRVIFSGQMPRYGTVLIIDHGERSYSLYGRLGEVLVSVGDVVTSSERVATIGPTDADGHNFYFELREQGKPVNPARYGLVK